MHDDLLAAMPEGARHDQALCPVCVDKAQTEVSSTSGNPPADGGPDATPTASTSQTEGGTNKQMTDISQETHEALLQKAITDATAAATAEIASLKETNATITAERDALQTEKAALLADNARLNGDLDNAQVSLKAATDEVASLKSDIAAKDEAAQKAEIASQRAAQVKNLGLFPEEYITEKASKWADVDEASWADRIEEWKAAKGDAPAADPAKQDAASALTGTDEAARTASTSTDNKPSARRAVLGLV